MPIHKPAAPKRSLWLAKDARSVVVLDQTRLPHRVETVTLRTLADAARAISDMIIRGAPLIGVTAAHGMAMAMAEDASDSNLGHAYNVLIATRPTAVNLRWALDLMRAHLAPLPLAQRRDAAFLKAAEQAGLLQLKGHKSVGGMRASIYNAMPLQGVQALVNFLQDFEQHHA